MRIAEKSEWTTREKGEFLMKHKTRTKTLSWLLSLTLMLSLVPGMGLTALATPAETLLTTITPTDQTTYSATTSGVVTVSHNNDKYSGQYGWQWGHAVDTLTVSGCEGYTITKVIFKQNEKNPVTDSSAPFELHFVTGKMRPVECQEDTEFDSVTSIEVYGYSNHTHSFTYSASDATITATCSAEGCKLPPSTDSGTDHVATLTIKPPANLVYSGNAKEATVEGTIPDVTTPDIMYKGRGGTNYSESTTAPTAIGDYTASVTLGGQTASVTFEIKDNTYTITIPATLDVANAGWNATDGITAYGEIAEDKKLTVTATSANGWKLTKTGQQETIAYKLAESGDSTTTYAGATEKTVWEFSVDELAKQGGTNKPMGAVVEEYINKPAGDYTDTVTFTASVEAAAKTLTLPGVGGYTKFTVTYTEGQKWSEITLPTGMSINSNFICSGNGNYELQANDNVVHSNDTINPNANYKWNAAAE